MQFIDQSTRVGTFVLDNNNLQRLDLERLST